MRWRWCLLYLILILLSACQSTPPRWITLAEAQQGRAPALYAHGGRLTAVWVGADSAGVHHDARQQINGELSPITVLPLPPTYPYDQRLYPAHDDSMFLLWLDRSLDVTRLYGALISPDLTIQRTAPISDGLALRYSAVSDGQGGLWVAWSGGLLSEPTLYMRHIDAEGRPLDQFRIASNAEYPTMIRTNEGTITLFWIQAGQVMRARLQDGLALETQNITSTISLAPGDRLYDFNAALDSTHAYVFWNVTRANGQLETWLASGEIAARYWNAPSSFTLSVNEDQSGLPPLRWASPLVGQLDSLLVAVESRLGVGVVELKGGAIIGYSTVLPDVYLIGTPTLAMRDQTLVLAWSNPDAPRAHLNLLEISG